MHTSEQGFNVIRAFEGRSLKAYKDEVGVWTIGYGNTNDEKDVLGFEIKAGVRITEAQCDQLLRTTMARKYEPSVNAHMGADPNQPSFDAGISFHYNTGAIGRASWVKSFVANNLPAVHTQITLWNKAGGNPLAGLTRRRNREWEMISQGNYGPEGRQTIITDEKGHPLAGQPSPATVAMPASSDTQAAPRVTTPGMLKVGDVGPEVKDAQVALAVAGYDVTPSGNFDKPTHDAVLAYQIAHVQLDTHGVIDPAMRAALKRDADMKSKLKTTTTSGGTVNAAMAGVDSVTGGHLPLTVYVVLGAIFVVAAVYFIWHYRDEIRAKF